MTDFWPRMPLQQVLDIRKGMQLHHIPFKANLLEER